MMIGDFDQNAQTFRICALSGTRCLTFHGKRSADFLQKTVSVYSHQIKC